MKSKVVIAIFKLENVTKEHNSISADFDEVSDAY